MRPRALFLVPSDLDGLRKKGVAHMITERDENGFFDTVITVHPLAFTNQTLQLNAAHRVIEFNLRAFLPPRGLNWFLLPLLPLRMTGVLGRLWRLIRQERISLIRANDPYLMGVMGLVLARLCGIPFCISIHADYAKTFRVKPKTGFGAFVRWLAAPLPRFVLPRADRVLVISEYLKGKLTGIPEQNIRVLPHGISMSFDQDAEVRETLNIPATAAIMSYVGRLAADNYVDDLLQIATRVIAARKNTVMVIVGGGELEDSLRARITCFPDVCDRILLTGFRPNAFARSLRAIADVNLCMEDGFSLLEACASGRPVVAYDVDWHGEVIDDNVTGRLIPLHDIDAYCDAIQDLLDHPDDALRLGRNARAFVVERHAIARTSQLKRHCYEELLSRSSRTE